MFSPCYTVGLRQKVQFVVVSQFEKIGTLVSVTKMSSSATEESSSRGAQTFSTRTLMGSDEEIWHVYAKQIGALVNEQCNKPVLLGIALKKHSPQILHQILTLLRSNSVWWCLFEKARGCQILKLAVHFWSEESTCNHQLLFVASHSIFQNKSLFFQHLFSLVWNTTYKNKVLSLLNYLLNWKVRDKTTVPHNAGFQAVRERASHSRAAAVRHMGKHTRKRKELFHFCYGIWHCSNSCLIFVHSRCTWATGMHVCWLKFVCQTVLKKKNRLASTKSSLVSVYK